MTQSRCALAFIMLTSTTLLFGCSWVPSVPSSEAPGTIAGASINGVGHGGQQPIVGARVYLLANNTTGNAGIGVAPTGSNASVSLLNASATGNAADSIGSYVLSGSYGQFSISGDYTCTAGQQLYVYALGGNPGAGVNSGSGLMALLGNCPTTGGNLASQVPYVYVSEVSTIAAAYAMAGYATDATHVSTSGTALAKIGITNAFANATNLVNVATGMAYSTTPTTGSNGIVPQAKMNTLGNIIAACINSTGPTSGPCTILFANAKSAGSSGNAPTDTATAAINMAHYPGSNVGVLFGLQTPSAPYMPNLSTLNDLVIAITYSGGGLKYPASIAIDAVGNVWAANYMSNTLTKVSPLGVATTALSTGLINPQGIAIDTSVPANVWIANGDNSLIKYPSGGSSTRYAPGHLDSPLYPSIDQSSNIWVADNDYPGGITKVSNSGTVASEYTTGPVSQGPWSTAIDSNNQAWLCTGSAVGRYNQTGTPATTSGFGGSSIKSCYSIAIDSADSAWIADTNNGSVDKIINSGATVTVFNGGSLTTNQPSALAIDGAQNVWIAPSSNSTSGKYAASELSNTGSFLSPTGGYLDSNFQGSFSLAIDGSGDVWIANYGSTGSLTEIIGSAAPVVTPIVASLLPSYGTAASRP